MLEYRKRKRQIRIKHGEDKHLRAKRYNIKDTINLSADGMIVNYYDLSFDDNFVDEGNMNKKYDDVNYLVDKYEIPNYIDAFDIEKYKINLKRTMMTGKH